MILIAFFEKYCTVNNYFVEILMAGGFTAQDQVILLRSKGEMDYLLLF